MNRTLTIVVDENARGQIIVGGTDTTNAAGVREALRMLEFARDTLTESLVEQRARELARTDDTLVDEGDES